MANIAILTDPYKNKYSVNLTDGPEAKYPHVWAKRNFRSPVKAMKYVNQLKDQGNIPLNIEELDQIYQKWMTIPQ